MAVKDMNDTTGPNGFALSQLLFGAIPKMSHVPHDKQNVNERIKAMEIARNEFEDAISRSRVDEALKKKSPAAAKYKNFPRHSVYDYREKHKGWSGPHEVTVCWEENTG